MKYLVVSFVLFFCTLQTFGQQEYFTYLQTTDNQAFYIRINNNVYSSTSGGYLILSKLPDNTVTVTIGFPKNVFPEQLFNIPVNRKDAGYLLKNFDDKGWGLVNLQTQAILMNSDPRQEKKSPEIAGVKKSDAFSLLLANAVNDTAVLYTVAKPPKLVPAPPVAVVEEKKIDSLAVAKEAPPKKDSAALVKNNAEKKDSGQLTKTMIQPPKDTVSSQPGHQAVKELAVLEKNKKAVADTASHENNIHPPAIAKANGKTATTKNNAAAIGKNVNARKDTIILIDTNASIAKTITAKNGNERKDTIIFMNGKPAETGRPVAKNAASEKELKLQAAAKRDSLQLVKNEAAKKKAAEKTIAPVNNPPTVVQTTNQKKDTAAALVKTAPVQPAEKIEPAVTDPVKRQRPLINKAAELLTDTSYVAVFVDESKDNFDTIRISIPFNEAAAFAKLDRPVTKETKLPDTGGARKPVDNNPPVLTEPAPAVVVKKDSNAADKIVKDTTKTGLPKEVAAGVVKKDTAGMDTANNKPVKDSTAAIIAQQKTVPAKKDSEPIINKPVADSNASTVAIKKDTNAGNATADSGKPAKTPAPAISFNSDCKEVALDADIDKLRIRMLMVASDDDKIVLAKKLYRLKCFSVKQVKALSELFKSDEGKYKWFDAVYPFVSDSGNFSSLSELIKNDYYLNRFKAMLRN